MNLLRIRPTRLGYYLFGLNFILMILAVGYSNNLLFLFALILFAQSLLWLADTVRFNHSSLSEVKISNCFAGEFSSLSFSLSDVRLKKIAFVINGKEYQITDFIHDENKTFCSVYFDKRGQYLLENLVYYDSRPFGLFAKKIEIKLDQKFYVYPRPIENVTLPVLQNTPTESGELDSHQKGEENFLGLGAYQGEDFKKISWKHFARTEDVLIKQGLSPHVSQLDLMLKPGASEADLSYMAGLMLAAHRSQLPFSFKIGSLFVPTSSGQSHLHYCLERLSEC